MKKILNIGVSQSYDDDLNRKIRISNLVSIITIIIMLSFLPLSIYLHQELSLYLNIYFILASTSNIILHHYRCHKSAFVSYTIAGYVYFLFATIFFGLNSNQHYFYIIMCMIAVVIFDNNFVIKLFIFAAILLFFLLKWYMKDRVGLVITSEELFKVQEVVGNIVLFLWFLITSIFLFFFKNDNIRHQKDLIEKKGIIEEKHKEITDSINYAERIQRSFLASTNLLDENLKDYFVFFRPKDIVSGDFYWASQLNNGSFAFCCADSTGHGVPGAIMSILNISSLEKAIEKETEPYKILNKTREIIIDRLKKDGSLEGGKDGMDCSLLVLNKDKTQLTFASANNPVFIVRAVTSNVHPLADVSRSETHELIEFKSDKMPVGKHDKDQEPFTPQTVQLQKGDVIYTLTDGFPDQFGGNKGKKYMIKNVKELFLQIAHLPMLEQERKLMEEFTIWKGGNEQIDDICIVGVRL
jgi:phosphoserine phosphatase RsbU/P